MQSFYTTFFFLAIFVTISLMYICCSSTSWVVKFSKVMKNIKCKHHKWRRNVQVLESQISLITDSLASEALINEASCTYYSETRLYEQVLKIGSLRNRTAERRGRQNAYVWQTWQAYYLCVLWWSSLKLMFSGLLPKVLFKGGWRYCCHACHTRFAVFFPLPSRCVSSLMSREKAKRATNVKWWELIQRELKHSRFFFQTYYCAFLICQAVSLQCHHTPHIW